MDLLWRLHPKRVFVGVDCGATTASITVCKGGHRGGGLRGGEGGGGLIDSGVE